MTQDLPPHAAVCALETGIEVSDDGEHVVISGVGARPPQAFDLSRHHARLLARALLEAAEEEERRAGKTQ